MCVLAFCFVHSVYLANLLAALASGEVTTLVPASAARRLSLAPGVLAAAALVYNIVTAVGPLALFAIRGFRELAVDASRITRERLGGHAAAPIVAGALIVIVYVAMWPDAMLPFVEERVRWFIDEIPRAATTDSSLLVRAHYVASLAADVRITLPLVNGLFPIVLGLGLVAYFGRAYATPVALALLTVFAGYGTGYFSTSVDAEVPAATFGLLGFLAVVRRRIGLGAFLIWFGLLFKITTGYYGISAAAWLGCELWHRRVDWRSVPMKATAAMAVFLTVYYAPFAVYVASRGGVYVFRSSGETWFVAPLLYFVDDLFEQFLAVVTLGILGIAFGRGHRMVAGYAAASLLILRCTTRPSGGYYTLIFVPLLALLVATLFVWLRATGGPRAQWFAAGLAGLALAYNVWWFETARETRLSRRMLRWDQVVQSIGSSAPPGTEVMWRKISPKYDLVRAGRRDLVFSVAPEQIEEAERWLVTSSPKVYIAPLSDAVVVPLARVGYRLLLPPVGPGGSYGLFVVMLRDA